MQQHAERAIEIAQTETAQNVTLSTRQGDLLLRCVGNADPKARYAPTPHGGVVLAAGNHGEHRLIADVYAADGAGFFHLMGEGRVVHTDQPSGRHGAACLKPGRWQFAKTRELSLDGSIIEQKD